MSEGFSYNEQPAIPPQEEQQPIQQPPAPKPPQPLQGDGFTTLEDLPEEKVESQGQQIIRAEEMLAAKNPPKPKSWQEDKRIALVIGIIGFIVLGVVFYFLFHSVGVI